MDGGTEWKGAFENISNKEIILRKVSRPHSSEFYDDIEKGVAMLEATEFAAQRQAKSLFWNAHEKIPRVTDELWAKARN